jgi:hypothetical protein
VVAQPRIVETAVSKTKGIDIHKAIQPQHAAEAHKLHHAESPSTGVVDLIESHDILRAVALQLRLY